MNSLEIAGYKMSYSKGSAFQMVYEDHRKFISTGTSAKSQEFRLREANYLKEGKFIEAFELTADNIKSKYGNKYNSAINEARTYYINTIIPELQKQMAAKALSVAGAVQ